MVQLYAKSKKPNNSQELLKKIMRDTAKYRQDLMENAAMENEAASWLAMKNSFWIAIKDTAAYIEDQCGIEITYTEQLDVKKLLYNKDGKTIDDRLEDIYKEYTLLGKDIGYLWRRLEVLMNTELVHIENLMIRKICDVIGHSTIFRLERSEGSCASCVGYHGLSFDVEAAPDVPLHPNCGCTLDIDEEEIDENDDLRDILIMLDELDWQ